MIHLISRHPRFSPNSVERDASIIEAVTGQLQIRGEQVQLHSEEELPCHFEAPQLILSMGRDPNTLQRLSEMERMGQCIVNSPTQSLHNTRHKFHRFFKELGAAPSFTARRPSREALLSQLSRPMWLKNNDTRVQTKQDVWWVESEKDLDEALVHFHQSSTNDFVAESHEQGSLIKFYGVLGTDFFSYHYSTPQHFSKFGHERHNLFSKCTLFSAEHLQRLATQIAQKTGLWCYGGDAIVKADGTIVLIDFNDWPSFSTCTTDAATAIAMLAQQMRSASNCRTSF